MKKILIVGGGGREHAIAQSIARDQPQADILFCEECAIPQLLSQARLALGEPLQVARQEAVDLVIVGPEAPLVAGLVDELEAAGITVFGPPQAVARLEGSKAFAKDFMGQYDVRTAACEVFTDMESALNYVQNLEQFPTVLKADGLAGGKGVLICENRAAAQQGIHNLMRDRIFQEAGATVVIEEYLEGYEASVLAFCDGSCIRPMLAAQDHKKIFEGERGANTGGMGCIAPHPKLTQDSPLWQDFERHVMAPTLKGLQDRGWDFCGIIFFGLLIQNGQCHLLEYNMRLGDPEAQTVLPLLETPLLEILQASLMGRLAEQEIRWRSACSCSVVAAAAGYPQSPRAGDEIASLSAAEPQTEGVYLAGVSYKNSSFYTAGGRVLVQNATAPDLQRARQQAYDRLRVHAFRGMQIRRDIGGAVIEPL